jgi:hypothetical protein
VIPAFTTIASLVPRSCSIEVTTANAIVFDIPSDSNEVHFRGLTIIIRESSAGAVIRYAPGSVNVYNTDFSVADCDIFNGGQDVLYLSGDDIGGWQIVNNRIFGRYDLIATGHCRNLFVSGNDLFATSLGDDENAVAIAWNLATGTSTAAGKSVIVGNRIVAESYASTGAQAAVCALDVRNPIPSSHHIDVIANSIKANVTGGTVNATGLGVQLSDTGLGVSGTNTPSIHVLGNLFNVTNAGSGTKKTIDNANSNYVLRSYGNMSSVGGSETLGSNVTAFTAF